jgi:hypothetical protein
MNIAVPVPPVASTPRIPLPQRTEVAFAGAPGDFFGLLVKGAALLIPTAGFYRFWLVTDIRRHLWGHTRIGRESLEYTGTGRELLIGFMIALAVLAPIYVAYFALGLAAERLQAFASVPLFLILYVFGQYAAYRARRYRATRTIFRGVRFWMTGSAWRYAGKTFLWDLATLFSLGLALPWRMAALERYKMQNTRFGDLPGDFVGTGGELFRRGVALWGLTVGLTILAGMLALLVSDVGKAFVLIGLLSVMSFALPIAYALFRGTLLRWLIEGVRFGPVALESRLRRDTVFGCCEMARRDDRLRDRCRRPRQRLFRGAHRRLEESSSAPRERLDELRLRCRGRAVALPPLPSRPWRLEALLPQPRALGGGRGLDHHRESLRRGSRRRGGRGGGQPRRGPRRRARRGRDLNDERRRPRGLLRRACRETSAGGAALRAGRT